MTISTENIIEALRTVLKNDQVTVNETVRELHGRDESYHAAMLPDIVVFPESTKDVSNVMKVSKEYQIAVVPFGLGSSLEGHIIPSKGGITIDFSLMNKVLEVRENDFLVKVQPGVTRTQLNKELKKYGLFSQSTRALMQHWAEWRQQMQVEQRPLNTESCVIKYAIWKLFWQMERSFIRGIWQQNLRLVFT